MRIVLCSVFRKLMLPLSLLVTTPSFSAPITPGLYTLQFGSSSNCLDVKDSIKDNGLPLQLATCTRSPAQTFKISEAGQGLYKIINTLSGKALDVQKALLAEGATLQQWDYTGAAQQKFAIEDLGSGEFVLKASHSQSFIGTLAAVDKKGTPVVQIGATAQIWRLNSADSLKPSEIKVSGRQLLVDGQPYVMRAVCWNPIRKGQVHPEGLTFLNPSAADWEMIETDLRLMKEMGANTIRTYEPILDYRVLERIQAHGFKLIVPVYSYHMGSFKMVENTIRRLKDHPTTLLWEIGNEWNFNNFYDQPEGAWGLGFESSKSIVQMVASSVRALDKRLPISTVYWGFPTKKLFDDMPEIDIWATNIYANLGFGNYFERWKDFTTKPLYVAEYGADVVNVNVIDHDSHVKAVTTLSRLLLQNLSARSPDQVVLGGAIFEWNDEWWKHKGGSPWEQEIEGIAPGGGPYPDKTFNEEWWGLVDIERTPRPAYHALKELWLSDAQ